MTIEWSLAAVQDVITDAIPDRDMLVWNDERRTCREVAERSKGLAGYLVDHGIGIRRERDELERWECGQATVALVMHNRPEYIESMYGCFRARAVPFNVNHQYNDAEIKALFDMVGAAAVIYQRSFGPLVAAAIDDATVLIDIDDGSGVDPLPGSVALDEAMTLGRGTALPETSGDDLYLVCTGGTTGAPKGVLWRQADIFVAAMAGAEDTTAESLATMVARAEPQGWFAAPPFMHAAAQWTAFCGLHSGGTVVMHDDSRRFDAAAILEVAEREHVMLISIVGDAYARPIVEELRRTSYDLSSLQRIGTGGAVTSMESKLALLELLPEVTVVDGYGASETGGMAFGAMNKSFTSKGLLPAGGALVLSADRSRFLEPGDDEIGWIARRGRVPLGYLDHQAATEATFPVVDGERLAVPGDRGQLEPDGSIRMLGRDSMVINTGGEKVFVEEVELALLDHPDVVDVLVVGRPSSRFGQEVVAVVQLEPGSEVDGAALREHCATSVARFKAPRAFAFTDTIGRHPSGKPDYQWARVAAEQAVALAGAGAGDGELIVDLGVSDQTFILFGGTRGIGFAAATTLAADGARLALAVGRDADRATEVAAALAERVSASVVGIGADLTREGEAERAVAEAVDALGSLNGAAITTGLGARGQRGLLDATDDDWAATYEDVLMGTVRASRAVVAELVQGSGGSIVTTAAYSIRAPKAHQFPYASLKAAVATMTKDLATSFGAKGIRANCVCPGATETEFLASFRVALAEERGWPVEEALERAMREDWGMDVALGRAATPAEVGDVIAFLLSARASYVTGAVINVDGGTNF